MKEQESANLVSLGKLNYILKRKRKAQDPFYSAAKLAEDLGIEVWRIPGIMKQLCGDNFNTVVNRIRIDEAKRLFKDRSKSDYSVDDIGFLSGFANKQSFYTAFKKFVGCTPYIYRRRCNDISEVSQT